MGCNCGGRRRGAAKAKKARVATSEARAAAITRAAGIGSAPKPKPAAAPEPQKPVRRPPPAARSGARVAPYTVVRGDTMASIAQRFGLTVKELVKFDGGTGIANIARLRSRNAHIIHPGEVILVPRKAE